MRCSSNTCQFSRRTAPTTGLRASSFCNSFIHSFVQSVSHSYSHSLSFNNSHSGSYRRVPGTLSSGQIREHLLPRLRLYNLDPLIVTANFSKFLTDSSLFSPPCTCRSRSRLNLIHFFLQLFLRSSLWGTCLCSSRLPSRSY